MSKYWMVKVSILVAAFLGVIWMIAALKEENDLDLIFNQAIPAKIITQPPKSPEAPPQH